MQSFSVHSLRAVHPPKTLTLHFSPAYWRTRFYTSHLLAAYTTYLLWQEMRMLTAKLTSFYRPLKFTIAPLPPHSKFLPSHFYRTIYTLFTLRNAVLPTQFTFNFHALLPKFTLTSIYRPRLKFTYHFVPHICIRRSFLPAYFYQPLLPLRKMT